METKRLPLTSLELKLSDTGMRFSGYASMFGGVDAYGDTIQKGAYVKTLQNRSRPIQLRWNHYGPVIGKWIQITEDEKGLFVEGELTPGHSVAEDTYALLKHGAVDGMSIGYYVRAFDQTSPDKRLLKEIELVEISVVEEPADLNARVGDVKSVIDTSTTLKEIESLLREAGGFSRTDATALVGRIKKLSLGEQEQKEPEIDDSVKNLILHRQVQMLTKGV